jgi:hypothetical protein
MQDGPIYGRFKRPEARVPLKVPPLILACRHLSVGVCCCRWAVDKQSTRAG